jgi:ABC-type glycerol-3-phosphate transport system substrate-binding protein
MTLRQIQCQQAQKLLPSYLDGTLTLGERELLDAHWTSCVQCDHERRNAEALDARTRSALRAVVSSQALSPQREALMRRRLLREGQQARLRRRLPRSGFSGIAAGIAALLLVASLGMAVLRPAPAPVAPTKWLTSYYAPGQADRDITFAEQAAPAPISAPVTITFYDPTLPPSAYAPLLKRFQAANADVTVEVHQPAPPLADAATFAQESDCFVAGANLSNSTTRGALLPITRFAQADGRLDTGDFFPQLLDMVSHDDQLYGLPRSAKLRLTFFDPVALARSGVPLPERGWTTDDLTAGVRTLRAALPADRYAFVSHDAFDVVYLLAQRGARAPRPHEARIDGGATAAAVNWYLGLTAPQGASPPLGIGSPDALARRHALVEARSAAIWTGPLVPSQKVTPRLGIAPLPADNGAPTTLQSDAYFISKQSAHPGACWRWIRYLSFQQLSPESVPARRSHVRSHAFVLQYSKRQSNIVIAALDRATPTQPWSRLAVAALGDAIDEVALRGRPTRSALTAAQRYLETEWL